MMPTHAYITRRDDLNRRARQFLREVLTDGPQPFSTIKEQAREAGIFLATLMTAKCALNIQSRKSNGHMLWQLRVGAWPP
jgi:hypothetical protein